MCFVEVARGRPIVVRVWALAVIEIKRSAKLLVELNELNRNCRTVSVRWQGDAVIVEQVMHIDGVRRATLRQAVESVGFGADDIGTTLATVFGGHPPIDTDSTEPHREAS